MAGGSQNPGSGARGPGFEARARALRGQLRALARELTATMGLPLQGPDAVTGLELRLALPLGDAPDEPGRDPLLEALLGELEARRGARERFADGRAWCFQCRAGDCVHAAPPDPRSVFLQYSATGKPVWRELTEACLVWGEPRIQELHGEPPGLIGVLRTGDELTAELIAGFGRGDRAYRLLGQVAVGYFPLRSLTGGPAERAALTLQVVGSRSGRGDLRLQLNPIGLEHDVASRRGYPEWWERQALRDLVRESRDELKALALRLGAASGPIRTRLEEGVAGVLSHLRSGLERLHRPQAHRTQHARERQREGTRPTHTALADAERAPDERLLYEPSRETVIVLAPKGRVHVFAEDGRHVTSLHHQRESIARKVDTRQWVPCEDERRVRFRSAIAGFLSATRDRD